MISSIFRLCTGCLSCSRRFHSALNNGRSRHHGAGKILEAAVSGFSAKCAEVAEIGWRLGPIRRARQAAVNQTLLVVSA